MASFCFTFADRLHTLASIPSSRSVRLVPFAIYHCNLQPKRGCLAKRPIHLSRILRNSHLAWEWCVSFFMIFLWFSLCFFFVDFVLVFPMVLCMCIFSMIRLWGALGVLGCSGLFWGALGCSGVLWGALGCSGVLWAALGCSGLLWGALGFSGLP